ncbi:hypothetical protein niasHT_037326 [Heterodera trifolii]|uniref:Uncharacterized protein n=1 Tax=Heterodera trifolii TaxID=157864 RepID=A0ABD2J510_9BILA
MELLLFRHDEFDKLYGSLWFAETAAEFLLAINRCLELLKPELAYVIFNGNKTWWLCTVPIVYAIAMAMFTKPLLFSGLNLAWFFNPYFGYTEDFGKITFLQVVIISFFNAISSGIYLSMQFVKISKIYIIIATYTWIFAHGCPPVVYLLLNKRIRNDCANFGRAIFRFLRNGNNSVSNVPIAMA